MGFPCDRNLDRNRPNGMRQMERLGSKTFRRWMDLDMVVLLSLRRFLGSIFWSPKKRFLNVFWMGNIMKYVNGVCFGLPRSTVFISHNSSFFVIGSLEEALPSFTARWWLKAYFILFYVFAVLFSKASLVEDLLYSYVFVFPTGKKISFIPRS